MKTNVIKPTTLARINPRLLAAFLGSFAAQFQSQNILLPALEQWDDYYSAVSHLLASIPNLPPPLLEALAAIQDCSTDSADQELDEAIARAALNIPKVSTPAEKAVQLWLANPALLDEVQARRRLLRLSAFDYIGTHTPPEQRRPFLAPDPDKIQKLTAALDAWFAAHNRGEETTRIHTYLIDGEFWFLIRHGNTFVRTSKVEGQKSEILQFRPEKDDVVVYSPEYDRLRINARTKGERELYRTQFGLCLRGHENYFSEPLAFTLAPLHGQGRTPFDPKGVRNITSLLLQELEFVHPGYNQQRTILKAFNVLNWQAADGQPQPALLPNPFLVRAVFSIEFLESPHDLATVEITLPDTLKISANADAHAVHRWLAGSGLITSRMAALKEELDFFMPMEPQPGAPAAAAPNHAFAY